ncbi:MAG: UDP-glucose 4-epimerase [Burkholderiaceae bacterium]|nr:MAG: UDP-glucose 4-epimerase [Burkholderiaceae bacterium]
MVAQQTLLTGGTGFAGRVLVRRLAASGRPVRLLVRRPDPDAGVPVHCVTDWSDEAALRGAMEGVDAVCHLAGLAHLTGRAPADEDQRFDAVNVGLSCRVAQAAFAAGVRRFVFVSSIGAVATSTRPGEALNEQSPCRPTTPYGRSKLRAEARLREIADAHHAELVVVRPPLVHGRNAPGNLARLAKLVATGLPLPLAGIANQRSLIHVDNLARVLELCLDHPAAAGETFHVRDLHDYSTPDILRGLARAMGRPPRMFGLPMPVLRWLAGAAGQRETFGQLTGWLQVDDAHVRALLGFVPAEVEFAA